jgi:hypothetical protein
LVLSQDDGSSPSDSDAVLAKDRILSRQFAHYFGNGQEKGKLAALFDERNTESITYRPRKILETELTGEDSKFLKARTQ